jgi:nicotinamidase-related amidase
MLKKALVIIDIQNDITKNYREIIDGINKSIDWAVKNDIHVVYIRHENLSAGTRT